MAGLASTVPAVKSWLFQQMSAALDGQDIGVFYSEPGPGYPDDVIYLGDTEQSNEPTQMVGSGGTGWLFESYHQVIEVDVYRGGDQAQIVFERACALVATIESLVRADPSLGGNITIVGYPAGTHYESGWEESHMGRVTHATMRISVENSL